MSHVTNNGRGMSELIVAVYDQAAKDLVAAYRNMRSQDRLIRDGAWRMVRECKKFFRDDPYGILSDPEWIIDECMHKGRRV